MSQLRVFVSHSSSDKPFADALVHALRQAGADVWYDEHNLGAGQMLNDIQRELATRAAFVVVLSKAAFASVWVHRECQWAFNLYSREHQHIILPVVAQPIEPADFNAMLFLEDFTRVERPGYRAYPQAEAIERTLRLLALTPNRAAPAPNIPQPTESSEELLAHGRALAAQRQYVTALPFLQRATQLAPGSFEAWDNLGYTCLQLKDWGPALDACECALAVDPNEPVAWITKGQALRGLCDHSHALLCFERALVLDPYSASGWRNRALSLHALGCNAEAQEAERRAKELGE